MTQSFLPEVASRELAQLLINERCELIESSVVTTRPFRQQRGHIVVVGHSYDLEFKGFQTSRII
jgi:hypothetical protein